MKLKGACKYDFHVIRETSMTMTFWDGLFKINDTVS